jgi:hypothetical protein
MTSLWEVDENILNKGVQGKLRRGGTGGIFLIFGQGSGVTPDSGEAVLRSRLGRNYRQLPVR